MKKKRDKKREKKGFCTKCGKHGPTEMHHIFGGSFRGKSEAQDFVIELCADCHRCMHDTTLGDRLKQQTQKKFEEVHSHEEWMLMMGRSWIL